MEEQNKPSIQPRLRQDPRLGRCRHSRWQWIGPDRTTVAANFQLSLKVRLVACCEAKMKFAVVIARTKMIQEDIATGQAMENRLPFSGSLTNQLFDERKTQKIESPLLNAMWGQTHSNQTG